mgnify:FL=1
MAKKITEKRLYNIALYYLSRYEATTGKVRDVLKRRLMTAERRGEEIPNEAPAWIEKIIAQMVDLGYIDNNRYAENTFRRLTEAGKSVRSIAYKLKQAGLEEDVLSNLIEEQETTSGELDLTSALKLVKKRKLGLYRPESQRAAYAQKDLAVLGRAGFSYEIAQKALKGEED